MTMNVVMYNKCFSFGLTISDSYILIAVSDFYRYECVWLYLLIRFVSLQPVSVRCFHVYIRSTLDSWIRGRVERGEGEGIAEVSSLRLEGTGSQLKSWTKRKVKQWTKSISQKKWRFILYSKTALVCQRWRPQYVYTDVVWPTRRDRVSFHLSKERRCRKQTPSTK